VLGRAFYIQKFQGQYWRSLSDSMHQKFVEVEPERGTIYSEDGQMLSTSVPYFDVYIDLAADGLREKKGKRFRENIDSFSISLSSFLNDRSTSEYKQELKEAYKEKDRYYLLAKGLTFDEFKIFRTFPLVRLGRNKSGIITEVKSKRLNPFGLLAKRTIGLSRDNAQNVGLERTYDSVLHGTKGKKLVRFISGGAAIPVDGYEIDPENGKDIITTIDMQMQDIVETALMNTLVESQSEYGTCILMETSTGKIKAIANLGLNKEGGYEESLNYALQSTEPGSTIKLATLLAVLDHGSSRITDAVEVGSTGSEFVGVRPVTEAEPMPKPVLTVQECFAHSSNVGMSKVAFKAFADQPDVYKNYLHKFHLDQRTGIDLLGEGAPVLPKLKRSRESLHAMITASFGYAIQVNPLQTLMLYNAIANNGKMMKPYLVSSINNGGFVVKEFHPVVVDEQICKPSIVNAAKLCMEAVTSEGTAKDVFKDFQIPVAGKTGTAHVAGGNITYDDGIYQASFVGYFPSNAPKYSCIVIIKTKPHALVHFGGKLAAPVFKEIAARINAVYVQPSLVQKIAGTTDSSSYAFAGNSSDLHNVLNELSVSLHDSSQNHGWGIVYRSNQHTIIKSVLIKRRVMTDVKNMTLKDGLYLLESMHLKVIAKGKGKIVAQNILPGEEISSNKTVTLLLN
ncbi:MAG TPA: penicillin-binding protein, partial [Flavisolibacter sp.]|nr:penicillin-binding protein [Flavisolibacter sp.]